MKLLFILTCSWGRFGISGDQASIVSTAEQSLETSATADLSLKIANHLVGSTNCDSSRGLLYHFISISRR